MRVLSAVICDRIDYGTGRATLVETFDGVALHAVPAHLTFCVWLYLEAEGATVGDEVEIELRLVPPDRGSDQAARQRDVQTVPPQDDPGLPATLTVDLTINATFRAFGPHVLEFLVDGVRLHTMPLRVERDATRLSE